MDSSALSVIASVLVAAAGLLSAYGVVRSQKAKAALDRVEREQAGQRLGLEHMETSLRRADQDHARLQQELDRADAIITRLRADMDGLRTEFELSERAREAEQRECTRRLREMADQLVELGGTPDV